MTLASMFAAAIAGVFTAAPAATAADLVVGSKNFPENRLLAEAMAQLIEAHTDLEVERRTNLGGTMVVFSALTAGEIDLYAEYTGTAWAIVLKEPEKVQDPLRVYLHVDREYRARYDLEWLDPFGFGNSYALAVRGDLAREHDLTRISDLIALAPDLKVGVSHEFLNREDGFPGLRDAYGLEFGDVRGMEHGLAFEAIDSGRIDVIDAWTTDGKLLRYDVRVLEDDRRFFPPYDCAPVARRDALAAHPDVAPLLERLAFRVDDRRMQELNRRVEVDGQAFERVARDFLAEEGLVDARADADADAVPERRKPLFAFVRGRVGVTLELAGQHLLLTLVSVGLAILLGVPLGIGLTRRERLAGPVLAAAGVVQTIPSLALLAFMIPLPGLGLGVRSAMAALFLYALLPIVRNSYTGIREVDPDLIDAARGIGLTSGQVLRLVELPLSLRTIMAGIRTSTVISIGVATIAAFIGAGGLGDPIVTGLQLNDPRLVMAGAVPAALLALLADSLLGRLERRLTPRGAGG